MKDKVKQGGVKPPLCILGTAPSLVEAPFGDETVEFWAVPGVFTHPEAKDAVDVLFELHPERWWRQPPVMEQLEEFGKPVYMQDAYPEIPNSLKFPREELRKKFMLDCMGQNLYVTNTITWMILKAIYDGYMDISLYGVHMAHDTEYAYQRASCAWAVGIIHGYILQGLPYKISISEGSHILRAEYEYGFDEPTKMMEYLQGRVAGMTAGITDAGSQITALKERQLRTEGAISEANHILGKMAGWR